MKWVVNEIYQIYYSGKKQQCKKDKRDGSQLIENTVALFTDDNKFSGISLINQMIVICIQSRTVYINKLPVFTLELIVYQIVYISAMLVYKLIIVVICIGIIIELKIILNITINKELRESTYLI